MSCLSADIADAIVSELNGETFSQTFTAVRKWIAKWTLSQLATLRVSVVPGPTTYEPMDRRRDDERHQVDIAIQQKIDPSSNTAIDALVTLLEEFVTHFRSRELTAGSVTIKCIGRQLVPGSEVAVAREHIEDFRCFTGILRTTWVLRTQPT